MYTQQRINWWLQRSASKEYQQAYDTILRTIQLPETGIIIDTACGPGELLKRVALIGTHQLVIGTDLSPHMLAHAQHHIAATGIPVRTCPPQELHPDMTGLILCQDDFLNSRIPREIADVVFSTFPEFGRTITPAAADLNHYTRLFDAAELPKPPVPDPEVLVTLRVHSQYARILKPGRQLIQANYDVSRGRTSSYDQSVNNGRDLLFNLVGITHKRSAFLESRKIWADTEDAKAGAPDLADAVKGYRIHTSHKNGTTTKPSTRLHQTTSAPRATASLHPATTTFPHYPNPYHAT